MRELLIQTLEALDYPVYLQGSIAKDDAYPSSFFTYWIFGASDSGHYDGQPNFCDYGIWIYFYSSDRSLVDSVPIAAKAALRNVGFVFVGQPADAASDEITHTGVVLTAHYKESL